MFKHAQVRLFLASAVSFASASAVVSAGIEEMKQEALLGVRAREAAAENLVVAWQCVSDAYFSRQIESRQGELFWIERTSAAFDFSAGRWGQAETRACAFNGEKRECYIEKEALASIHYENTQHPYGTLPDSYTFYLHWFGTTTSTWNMLLGREGGSMRSGALLDVSLNENKALSTDGVTRWSVDAGTGELMAEQELGGGSFIYRWRFAGGDLVGLELKGSSEKPLMSATFSDFREVGGARFPFRVVADNHNPAAGSDARCVLAIDVLGMFDVETAGRALESFSLVDRLPNNTTVNSAKGGWVTNGDEDSYRSLADSLLGAGTTASWREWAAAEASP